MYVYLSNIILRGGQIAAVCIWRYMV